jgi:hypothetical protein
MADVYVKHNYLVKLLRLQNQGKFERFRGDFWCLDIERRLARDPSAQGL